MECTCCKVRGAVESCTECHMLLCEACLIKCERCDKIVCPDHFYKTRSGRTLCVTCQDERKARSKQRERMVDPDEDDVAAIARGREEEEAEEERVLTASAAKPPPPWKLSVYTAGTAIAIAIVMFIFPSLRRFPVPWGGFFATPYILLVLPFVAAFWAALGMSSKENEAEGRKCLIGLGLSALATVLLIAAAVTDPARTEEQRALQEQMQRSNMTPEQLQQYREEKLNRFKR